MITSQQFINKKTGEIVTQVPLSDISNYEPVQAVTIKASDLAKRMGIPFTQL